MGKTSNERAKYDGTNDKALHPPHFICIPKLRYIPGEKWDAKVI